jgi:hypothetical protein
LLALVISSVGDRETQTIAQQLAEFRVRALGREELQQRGLKTTTPNNKGRVVSICKPASMAKSAQYSVEEEVITLACAIRDDQRT